MKPGWGRIDAAKIGDTIESLKSTIVQPTARALVELQAMLSSGLTFTDNFNSSIITRDLVHGVEQPITLGFKPVGVYALRSEALGANARYAIESLDWRIDAPGGTIGVTATYAPPFGGTVAVRTTDTTIATSSNVAISFESTDIASGGIAWSIATPTRLTFAADGIVSAGYQLQYDTNVSGFRQAWILKNTVSEQYAKMVMPPGSTAGAAYVGMNGSDEFTVSAGEYVELVTWQNSGSTLSIAAAGADRCAMRARYVSPPLTATNTVTLLCVGG